MIKDETLREVILRVDRETAIHLLANSDSLTKRFTEDEFMEQVTFGLFDKQEYRLRTRIFRAIYRKAKLYEEMKREIRNQPFLKKGERK